MILKSLSMEQFRGFTKAVTLGFHPQLTLIIGENGAGKSTILDALRCMLSHSLSFVRRNRPSRLNFEQPDVASGWPFLRTQSVLHSVPERMAVVCNVQKFVHGFADRNLPDGNPYDQVLDTKDRYDMTFEAVGQPHEKIADDKPPLFVYYSAHRSLALERGNRKGKEAGGELAAYTGALDDRPLELGTQAWLWHAEQELLKSDGLPARVNAAIERMLGAFLGDFQNLRTIEVNESPRLVVDKNKTTLDLAQLSDGEKGILALLLDLTRRLGQLHTRSESPETEPAIVMIDELDLHLHPRWQRAICKNLLSAFPNVQFIATTHSPQILGEVPAGQVIQIEDHKVKHIWQSFGMDTNWLLTHVMHGGVRNSSVDKSLREIESQLETFNLEGAEAVLNQLRTQIGETPDTTAYDSKIHRAWQLIASEADADNSSEPDGEEAEGKSR